MFAIASKARDDRAFGRADEVAGGVVDEPGERALGEDVRMPSRRPGASRMSTEKAFTSPPCARASPRSAASSSTPCARTADHDIGAELQETLAHRPAQTGAAAGHEDALAAHQILVEHVRLAMQSHWNRDFYIALVSRTFARPR